MLRKMVLTLAACALTACSPPPDDVHGDQAPALAKFRDIATRKGDMLTVRYDGKPVAHLKDITPARCDNPGGMGACTIWELLGTIDLKPDSGTTKQRYVTVRVYPGEGNYTGFIDRNGQPIIFNGNVQASPDGRYLIAYSGGGVHSLPFLRIVDWALPGHTEDVMTDTFCEPKTWTSAAGFDCIYDGEKGESRPGHVERQSNGQWQLTLSGQTPEFLQPTPQDNIYTKLGPRDVDPQSFQP